MREDLDVTPGAVLFDLDGTLVDSGPIWLAALAALVRRRQPDFPPDTLAGLVGVGCRDAVALVYDRLGWPGTEHQREADWVEARVRDTYRRHGVRWREGALALVDAIRAAGIRTGLVTSSTRTVVEAVVEQPGAPTFDVLVCGDDVVFVKPDPEPYLTAAKTLSLSPGDCLAIEDSPSGIASARAAGCRVVLLSVDGHDRGGDGLTVIRGFPEVHVEWLVDGWPPHSGTRTRLAVPAIRSGYSTPFK